MGDQPASPRRRSPAPAAWAVRSRWWLLAAALSVFAGAIASSASAASTLTWANPCSGDPNPATCERLTWIADQLNGSGVNSGDGFYQGILDLRLLGAFLIGVVAFAAVASFVRSVLGNG